MENGLFYPFLRKYAFLFFLFFNQKESVFFENLSFLYFSAEGIAVLSGAGFCSRLHCVVP